MNLVCPACRTAARRPGQYLCPDCWSALSARARRSLSRRDRLALKRLRELHAEIEAAVPLPDIEVTT